MASASLATMHTACVRLRDALDRWLAAFEVMAHEAAAVGAVKKTEPARKRLGSANSVKLLELASREGGVTAVDAAPRVNLTRASVSARLCNLADRGHLTKIAMPGRPVHFFRKAEDAAAWAASGGPPELEAADAREVLEVGMPATAPAAPVPDLQLLSAGVAEFAAMVEADAAAVSKAMSVIAPTPRAPRQKALIPPTPSPAQRPPGSEASNATRDATPRPTGEVIVPADVKRTTVEAPKFDARFGVDPDKPVEGGFRDEWRRLRGEVV